MTEALQATLNRRFLEARESLRAALTGASLQHRIMMAVADTIEDFLPDWLQVGPIDTFLDVADSFDERYRKIVVSLDWLDNLERWHEQGKVKFRPSVALPGDIDVSIDPDVVPDVPAALKSTVQITNLSGAQVWVFIGLIAGIAVLKIGTDFLSDQEKTTRKQYEFLISKMLLESTAPEDVKVRVATLMQEWKKTPDEPESVGTQISRVLMWAAIAGGVVGTLSLLLQYVKWRSEQKAG